MIDFYTWTTPNGRKVSILLEELGLNYRTIPVNLGALEQKSAAFLAINPNGKIPAIVDYTEDGPLSVFESGAIMIHLAEKHGRFLPTEPHGRARTMEWLMFQMSGIGPFIGQVNYWINTAQEKVPQAIQRYVDESVRLLEVFNGALAGREFIAGDYSIADMAAYPWIQAAWGPFSGMMPDKVEAMPNIRAWLDRLGSREAVVRGMAVPQVA
jgi:GST-like protein